MTPANRTARDMRRLRRKAEEIIRQVGHFERNTARGAEDTIRALVGDGYAREAAAISGRMARRWRRSRNAERRAAKVSAGRPESR